MAPDGRLASRIRRRLPFRVGPGRCGAKGNTPACGVAVTAKPQSHRKDPPSECLSTREGGLGLFSSPGYIDAVTLIRGGAIGPGRLNVTRDGVGLYPRCSRCFRSMMCAARCAAVRDRFGVWKIGFREIEIRRRALSGQQPFRWRVGYVAVRCPRWAFPPELSGGPEPPGLFLRPRFMAGVKACHTACSVNAVFVFPGKYEPEKIETAKNRRQCGSSSSKAVRSPTQGNKAQRRSRSALC